MTRYRRALSAPAHPFGAEIAAKEMAYAPSRGGLGPRLFTTDSTRSASPEHRVAGPASVVRSPRMIASLGDRCGVAADPAAQPLVIFPSCQRSAAPPPRVALISIPWPTSLTNPGSRCTRRGAAQSPDPAQPISPDKHMVLPGRGSAASDDQSRWRIPLARFRTTPARAIRDWVIVPPFQGTAGACRRGPESCAEKPTICPASLIGTASLIAVSLGKAPRNCICRLTQRNARGKPRRGLLQPTNSPLCPSIPVARGGSRQVRRFRGRPSGNGPTGTRSAYRPRFGFGPGPDHGCCGRQRLVRSPQGCRDPPSPSPRRTRSE